MQTKPFQALAALAVITLGFSTSGARAEEPKPASNPLTPLNMCRTIADPAQRVACYDSALDNLNAAVTREDVRVVDKATMKEARTGLFGFNIGKIRLFGSDRKDSVEPEDASELTAKIASARRTPDGRWRFTLETGAVWETTEPLRGIRDPEPGGEVQLKKAAMGSYFAKFGKGTATRAKRVN
jgi:hypothetical protein